MANYEINLGTMVMTQPSDKILERIKNLLALATGDGGTEPERRLAMERAKELMARYALSTDDLSGSTKSDIFNEIFQPSGLVPLSSTLVKYLPLILESIARSFGGFTTFSKASGKVWIYGYAPNIAIIQYASNVVLGQGWSDLKKAMREHRSMALVEGFWHGFSEAVREKFKPTLKDAEYALTIYDEVEALKRTFGSTSIDPLGSFGKDSGTASGRNVQVHKAVGASQKGNLLG